jgi:hypothetical protein
MVNPQSAQQPPVNENAEQMHVWCVIKIIAEQSIVAIGNDPVSQIGVISKPEYILPVVTPIASAIFGLLEKRFYMTGKTLSLLPRLLVNTRRTHTSTLFQHSLNSAAHCED